MIIQLIHNNTPSRAQNNPINTQNDKAFNDDKKSTQYNTVITCTILTDNYKIINTVKILNHIALIIYNILHATNYGRIFFIEH